MSKQVAEFINGISEQGVLVTNRFEFETSEGPYWWSNSSLTPQAEWLKKVQFEATMAERFAWWIEARLSARAAGTTVAYIKNLRTSLAQVNEILARLNRLNDILRAERNAKDALAAL